MQKRTKTRKALSLGKINVMHQSFSRHSRTEKLFFTMCVLLLEILPFWESNKGNVATMLWSMPVFLFFVLAFESSVWVTAANPAQLLNKQSQASFGKETLKILTKKKLLLLVWSWASKRNFIRKSNLGPFQRGTGGMKEGGEGSNEGDWNRSRERS